MTIMTIVALEMNFEIITYLILYGLIGICLFYYLKYFKFFGLKSNIILVIIFTSLFPTYILTASIVIYETNVSYSKIKSIPKDKLIEFYISNDINTIPKDKRRAWIGILYRKINIVSENRIDRIKAVGWRGNSVFAYYNIEEDDYIVSYH